MELNRESIVWAAGLFEGEGSISLSKLPSGKVYPRLKLKMCDKDVVEKFASVFKLKVQDVQKDRTWKSHWKDAYYCDVCGSKAVGILFMIYSFLGSRRKAKAEEVIYLWKQN